MNTRTDMFQVEKKTADLVLLDDSGVAARRKTLYSKPLRQSPDGTLGALHEGKVFPLRLDESGNLVAVLNFQSYMVSSCTFVERGSQYHLPYLFAPIDNRYNSSDISWKIRANQFGIYVYLNSPDDVVEGLVVALSNRRYRVISWDSTDKESCVGARFSWYIQLSSGLSSTAVANFLKGFFGTRVDLKQDLPDPKISEERGQLDFLKQKMKDQSKSKNLEIRSLYEELKTAYLEVSNLSEQVRQAESLIQSESFGQEVGNRARSLKRSQAERVIANLLMVLFPELAFSPDCPNAVSTRFERSKELWSLLSRLNDGEQVKMIAIHGLPGKVGWREVAKHVSSGRDARGRVYLRSSKGNHRYDVVLHWKSSNTEQARTMKNLANYKAFSGPEVVNH